MGHDELRTAAVELRRDWGSAGPEPQAARVNFVAIKSGIAKYLDRYLTVALQIDLGNHIDASHAITQLLAGSAAVIVGDRHRREERAADRIVVAGGECARRQHAIRSLHDGCSHRFDGAVAPVDARNKGLSRVRLGTAEARIRKSPRDRSYQQLPAAAVCDIKGIVSCERRCD